MFPLDSNVVQLGTTYPSVLSLNTSEPLQYTLLYLSKLLLLPKTIHNTHAFGAFFQRKGEKDLPSLKEELVNADLFRLGVEQNPPGLPGEASKSNPRPRLKECWLLQDRPS